MIYYIFVNINEKLQHPIPIGPEEATGVTYSYINNYEFGYDYIFKDNKYRKFKGYDYLERAF